MIFYFYFINQYGFNGGLSVSHLTQTKVNWVTHIAKKKDKDHYKKCGEIIVKWLEEATRRQQRQVCRAIAPLYSDKERQDASKKALQNLKNDCSDITDSSSPFFGQFVRMMVEDGGYPAHRPPALNPDQGGAAAGEPQASASSGAQVSAPADPPPRYASTEETSSTRSGTAYNEKRRKRCSKDLEELLSTNLKDLTLHSRRNATMDPRGPETSFCTPAKHRNRWGKTGC